jgi:hypothetical protein
MKRQIKTPWPNLGGKGGTIGKKIWERLGDPLWYFEPFIAGGGCLLSRPPSEPKHEIIGDIYCLVENFWRAAKLAGPEQLADLAAWPPSGLSLMARDRWLAEQRPWLYRNLAADPMWYDVRCAAWYSWKCSARFSCNAPGHILQFGRRGVLRRQDLVEYFTAMKQRLSHVTFHHGSWERIAKMAISQCKRSDGGIMLDPPYLAEGRRMGLYVHDSPDIAHSVRRWAIAVSQTHPRLRIALCGMRGEHEMPDDWDILNWQNRTGSQESIWFSPNCIEPKSTAPKRKK